MKFLDKNEADNLLQSIDMQIGNWNEIKYLNKKRVEKEQFVSHQAPRDVSQLYCFAQRIYEWLPTGDWQLFQIDNSTVPFPDELFLLIRILGINSSVFNFYRNQSLLFEFGLDKGENIKTRLTISYIIYLFLASQQHGSITSSGSRDGEILSVQDGFVGFISRGNNLVEASKLIYECKNNPLQLSNLICDLKSSFCENPSGCLI